MPQDRDLAALRIARAALDLPPAEQAEFVSARCTGDAALEIEVQAILAEVPAADADLDTATPLDPLIGSRLGPFLVRERIGRGGMGVVYRGEREGGDFRQEVALKLIRRGFDFDEIHARFLRERRILARLDHAGIARLVDGGSAPDGRPWFALEFVRGVPITRWCDEHRLDLRARLRLLLEVCAAVQHAHARLVLHRDLKPANILVDDQGRVHLLDFGIARLLDAEEAGATLTRAGGGGLFTPAWAAPEQFSGEHVGIATDVYALGAVAYALVAGVPPHELAGRDLGEAGRIVREEPLPSLTQAILRPVPGGADESAQRLARRGSSLGAYRKQVRGDLSRIVAKALATEPDRRYASAQAFADDLANWLAGRPVRATGQATGYRLRKFLLRNRVAAGFALLALLALGGGLAATLRQMHETRVQRDAALAEVRRAESTRQYLMLMFRDAAARGEGGQLDAREVFHHGAERLFEHFAGQPEAGQETALMLSDLFLQLADVEGAVPLLEQLLASPGIAANPAVQAHARYNLAQAELERGQPERAQALLDQARAWWSGADGILAQTLLNESRITQARLQRLRGEVEESLQTLRAAISERQALLGTADAEVGSQYVSLAIGLLQAGRVEEAEAAADAGYAVYERLGLAESDGGMAALNARAHIAFGSGRTGDGIADFRRVVAATRALYGETPKLATAMNNLGVALLRHDEAAEAAQVLEEALRVAVATAGERSRPVVALRCALAEAWATLGRADEAAPLVERAVEVATGDFPADPLLAGTAWRVQARVELARGRRAEARARLERARASFASAGPAGEPYLRLLAGLAAELGEP